MNGREIAPMRVLRLRTGMDIYKRLDAFDAVAVRTDAVESLEEMELAFHLAKKSFERKKNIAKKRKYEFLLWLAGKTDITSAMKATAPFGGEILLVVFSDGNEREILELLDAEKRPLSLKKKAEPLALEMISLSRVKT